MKISNKLRNSIEKIIEDSFSLASKEVEEMYRNNEITRNQCIIINSFIGIGIVNATREVKQAIESYRK